jgi:hypothetical protein
MQCSEPGIALCCLFSNSNARSTLPCTIHDEEYGEPTGAPEYGVCRNPGPTPPR